MSEILPISQEQLERFIGQEYENYLSARTSLKGVLTPSQFRDQWMNEHQFVVEKDKVYSLGIGSHLIKKGGTLSNFLENDKKQKKSRDIRQTEESSSGRARKDSDDFDSRRYRDQQEINEKNDAKLRKAGLLPKEDSLGVIKTRREIDDESFGRTPLSEYGEPILPDEQIESDVYGRPPLRNDPAAGEKG